MRCTSPPYNFGLEYKNDKNKDAMAAIFCAKFILLNF